MYIDKIPVFKVPAFAKNRVGFAANETRDAYYQRLDKEVEAQFNHPSLLSGLGKLVVQVSKIIGVPVVVYTLMSAVNL